MECCSDFVCMEEIIGRCDKTYMPYRVFFVSKPSRSTCPTCENKWFTFNGSCYLIQLNLTTFYEAVNICYSHGASLVHVDDKAENDFIKALLRNAVYQDYWIGMTENRHIWRYYDTKKTVTFYDWEQGEPDHRNENEHCAIFGNTINYHWADVVCDSHRMFVCEKSISVDVNLCVAGRDKTSTAFWPRLLSVK
ncbi:killer cell lectin-like receptor [Mactra antiquata]